MNDYKAGSTSVVELIFLQDSTKSDGSGKTGLAFNTSGLTCYYKRSAGTTSVQVTLANISTLGTFASGGFKEIDAAGMPGCYEFHPPDAAFASGAKEVTFFFTGVMGLAPRPIKFRLVAVDPDDAAAFGVTRIDTTVGSRLATVGYTAPDNATISAIAALAAAVKAKTDNLPASPAAVGSAMALANGAIDVATFTATAIQLLTRRLIMTGVTTPLTADSYRVGGFYNNTTFYQSTTLGTTMYAWYNGSNWTISSAVGTNGSAYWTTAPGSSVLGPYSAQGTASGTPSVDAHGNAVLAGFQPDLSPAQAGDAMALVNGAITSAKFTVAAPTGVATGVLEKIDQLWRKFFKKSTLTSTQLKTYADDGTTPLTTQPVSDDGTTQTQGDAV